MTRTIILIPTSRNAGLTSVTLGIVNIAEQKKLPIQVLKPIYENNINSFMQIKNFIKIKRAEYLLKSNEKNVLIKEIISYFYKNKKNSKIILIHGFSLTSKNKWINYLYYEISKFLNAEIIFITVPDDKNDKILNIELKIIKNIFFYNEKNIIGIIINKINAPIKEKYNYICNFYYFEKNLLLNNRKNNINSFYFGYTKILSYIPWNKELNNVKAIDICEYLKAKIIYKGEILNRNITSVICCLKNTSELIKFFSSSSLLIISAKRFDILFSVCLSIIKGVKIGAILLTNINRLDNYIIQLCQSIFKEKLPIFIIKHDILQAYLKLKDTQLKFLEKDLKKIDFTKKYISSYINFNFFNELYNMKFKKEKKISSYIFIDRILKLANKANKTIVLPEGNEIRIIKAASICAQQKIANCILLGNPKEIYHIAKKEQIKLKNIEIINPKIVSKNYIKKLIELRKNKGMTKEIATKQLKNNIILGTMMLENNEVDGLVSGAVNTTADTIRPALQLIKTNSNNSLISSLFFMLLPKQVLVYSDCAININPTEEQLAEIAIQSSDSATLFGIKPIIAMISYSTGNSSKGDDVDKIKKATNIVKNIRPDLIIDGPLQYDAAIIPEVAKLKAPKSPVAGNATVIIFPDLNTGNTVYKAVQRSANIIAIGPMLQGIKKPVNDLSRGSLVDDIVNTIMLTVIQSLKK